MLESLPKTSKKLDTICDRILSCFLKELFLFQVNIVLLIIAETLYILMKFSY